MEVSELTGLENFPYFGYNIFAKYVYGAVAKWLLRQFRKLLLFEGAGSNPAGVVRYFIFRFIRDKPIKQSNRVRCCVVCWASSYSKQVIRNSTLRRTEKVFAARAIRTLTRSTDIENLSLSSTAKSISVGL